MTLNDELFNITKRLKSIADIGLLYSQDGYNTDRYAEILRMSDELSQKIAGQEITCWKDVQFAHKDYPTAKVDIRGLVIEAGRILLVKESADKKWSLPGGWADIGYSPAEVVIKECREETGLEVVPERLLAVFDKKFHPHPPQPFYVYKLMFQCRPVTSTIIKGFDVLDVDYFATDQLPELSEDRILKSQLELLIKMAAVAGAETYFE